MPLTALSLRLSVAVLACLPATAGAQNVAYSLTRIEPVGGAFGTVATGFNDLGHAVGWSNFFDGGPLLRGWVWTPETGLTYLPQPPGQNTWSASDLNEDGIISGDGGPNSGQAWRYDGASYELLGSLPDGNMSIASTVNSLGEIAGTSRDSQSFLTPPDAFVAAPGSPLLEVSPSGWATHSNDAGQVVGYFASNKAYLFTPGAGAELLGPLGSKPLTWAWSINASGTVVGEAAASNGNGHVPWIREPRGALVQIGNFGGGAAAFDINDAGVVLGEFDTSGPPQPWTWTADDGITFLAPLIDPNEQIGLLSPVRINNAGQVLCLAIDQTTGQRLPVVLTPVPEPQLWTNLGSSLAGTHGKPRLAVDGVVEASAPVGIALHGALENSTAYFVLGLSTVNAAFKGGTLVPAFSAPQGLVFTRTTGPTGTVNLSSSWPADLSTGLTFILQVWVQDPGGPAGFAASNAVSS